MILYAESSAILAWLLGEPSQQQTLKCLRNAEHVYTSALTGVECARGLGRACAGGRISAVEELAALRLLDNALASWHVYDLGDDVLARARVGFSVEPVRTLDALHLATAEILRSVLGELTILSFDERVRENARAMRFTLATQPSA